ncbi:hypothetical protein IWX76_002352 [Pedobacter sp. CAN_A7]|uniref:hypothetical protein n=1 Tax=Pedobacter sp. CAN_A7 TaxID=2787722 RepID=UPI0018C924A1
MKRLIVFAMLGFAALAVTPAKAQVSVNINIGSQPDWGPRGYNHVDYYYLPEVESYYYVPTRKFIYLSGGNWRHSNNLPSRYRGYNLHNGRKVVINSHRPYLQHNNYKKRYASHNYAPVRYNQSNNRRIASRDHYINKRVVAHRSYDNNRSSYNRKDNRSYQKQGKHHDNRNQKGRGENDNRGNGRGHGNGRH